MPAGEWGDGSLDPGTNNYCIYARRQYNPRDEVFLCYGRHTNLELLEHYGFVLQDSNPHDIAVLPLSALPEAVVMQLRDMGAEAIMHNDGNPSWEMLRVLRIAALNPAQRKSSAWIALNDQKIDDVSELWAMETLKKSCLDALNGLETSLEQDEEILRSDKLSEGMQVAVQWRAGYKQILRKGVALFSAVIASLEVNNKKEFIHTQPLANLVIRQPKLMGSERAKTAVPPAQRK